MLFVIFIIYSILTAPSTRTIYSIINAMYLLLHALKNHILGRCKLSVRFDDSQRAHHAHQLDHPDGAGPLIRVARHDPGNAVDGGSGAVDGAVQCAKAISSGNGVLEMVNGGAYGCNGAIYLYMSLVK